MAWAPVESEAALVDCTLEARDGVRFDLFVTDEHLCYSRPKHLTNDPVETVMVERRRITGATFTKKTPWFLYALGLTITVATGAVLVALSFSWRDGLIFGAVGLGLAAVCFSSAPKRWRLRFSDGERVHTIDQPAARSAEHRDAITSALRATARLLSAA